MYSWLSNGEHFKDVRASSLPGFIPGGYEFVIAAISHGVNETKFVDFV